VLSDRLRQAGLFDRRRGYYAVKLVITVSGLLAGWVSLVVVGNSWASVALAAYLALLTTQVVFLGHDAGHQQIFVRSGANQIAGLALGDTLSGLSYGWWVTKHTAHHTHPNQVDRDPDIGAGVISFTPEIARRRHGLAAIVTRHQAWLFFPLLLLEGAALHLSSVQSLVKRRDRAALVEAGLLLVHSGLYFGVVFTVLSPLRAVIFVVVQQGLFGLYLGSTFAPNHKGMPIIDRDSTQSFFGRQISTARNVTGGRVITFVLGGLNYQIEHHLFPTMPRPSLPRAQIVVEAFCLDRGVPYCQTSLLQSYCQAIQHLRRVGATDDIIS
jgi:fatty acid desaturase